MASPLNALVVALAVAHLLATLFMAGPIPGSSTLTAMLTIVMIISKTRTCLSGLLVPT